MTQKCGVPLEGFLYHLIALKLFKRNGDVQTSELDSINVLYL